MDKDFFNGKSVLVMGLGRFGGGLDSALFAHDAGAEVTVTDLVDEKGLAESLARLSEYKDIEYHLGGHREEDFCSSDIIIVNPAVAGDNMFLNIARKAGKTITSQIEIFLQLCPCRIVGITGSNGKSTTAALTAHLLKAGMGQAKTDYENVWLSGNIGNQPLLARLDQISAKDVVVLELSSFQLEQLRRIKKTPDVAVITNLTPNHLDRHGTFEVYCDAKEVIFKYQRLDASQPVVSVFNAEDTITAEWFARYSIERRRCCLTFRTGDVPQELARRFTLVGTANLSNLAAALKVAEYFGVNDERIAGAVETFKPLPHRLELVARIAGVSWYDDSIATTPQSAIAALEAFTRPKIIIAGGFDKNLSFDRLGEAIARKTKAAILIGQTADKIAQAIGAAGRGDSHIEIVSSLADAVTRAAALARAGDVVLLSPACASYDMFDNYHHRGSLFRTMVGNLSQ